MSLRFSGRRLRELRIAAGYRTEELCVAIGRSFPSVRGYETGRLVPPTKTLLQLATVLDCGLEDLFEDDEVPAGVA